MAEIIRRGKGILPRREIGSGGDLSRPQIKFTRLLGFTQDDLRLIGGGDLAVGVARYFEEMNRLLQAGELTSGGRIFGAELDALRSNLIPPVIKDVEN